MLIGRYYHHLESKGRLSLPKSFREQAPNWIITRGLDGSLFLFPESTFQSEIDQLANKPFTKQAHRDFIRLITNDATLVTPDSLGRITLPEYLIQSANLSKQLVIVGSLSRVEIWDQDTYHLYLAKIESNAENIAESLDANQ